MNESLKYPPIATSILTHRGQVTLICVSELIIIRSDNGLAPGRCQDIIRTKAVMLLIGPLETNFGEILIGIQIFVFKKMYLKMSSAKWRPFCFGFNSLKPCGAYIRQWPESSLVQVMSCGLLSTPTNYLSQIGHIFSQTSRDLILWYLLKTTKKVNVTWKIAPVCFRVHLVNPRNLGNHFELYHPSLGNIFEIVDCEEHFAKKCLIHLHHFANVYCWWFYTLFGHA